MLQHGSCSACTAAQLQQRSLRTAELHSGARGTAAHVRTNTAVYGYIDLAASRLAVYVITHMQPCMQHIINISQESAV